MTLSEILEKEKPSEKAKKETEHYDKLHEVNDMMNGV